MGKVFFSVWRSGPPREPMTSPSFSPPREKLQSNHNKSMKPSFVLSLLQSNPNRNHHFHWPCRLQQISFIESWRVPGFMIMLIGCWSRDAFLCYIRKQVMEFSQNVAKKMLLCQNFWHIPDIHTRIHSEDPRIRNHPDNVETRRNVGGDSRRHARLPPFTQFN